MRAHVPKVNRSTVSKTIRWCRMAARLVSYDVITFIRGKTRKIRWLVFLLLALCVLLYVTFHVRMFDIYSFTTPFVNSPAPIKYASHKRETHGLKNEFQNPAGTVWPLPQMYLTSDNCFLLKPDEFSFNATDKTCYILEVAFKRYHSLIFNPPRLLRPAITMESTSPDSEYLLLRSLQVSLKNSCEMWPSLNMDEKYELKIDTEDLQGQALLQSESVWGILRGLETFSQLIYLNEDGEFQVNGTHIVDFPRFSHRGIMLDTARHFIPKKIILDNLDAMAMNKFNVFHWHIVDDQSFPYQSKKFPLLSEKGSFYPQTHIYTPKDVAEIVEYARLRGIRVIPEFDTPGHTRSWGLAMPELLTPCYDSEGKNITNKYGPFNPIQNTTYLFLKEFFAEVGELFPDKYIHLGGDEVELTCWVTNQEIDAFMKSMSFGKVGLQEYYIRRLMNTFPDNVSFIVWFDVFTRKMKYKQDTIFQIWTASYEMKLYHTTASGYRTILSSCWYLDQTRDLYFADWHKLYDCEPLDFGGTAKQNRLVIGGEACMWAEAVDGTNLMTRVWPRACAVSERLWSAKIVRNATIALPRLAEHRCRMLYRGINAEPQHGLSYCNVDFNTF